MPSCIGYVVFGLLLDDLACIGCRRGAANVPPVRAATMDARGGEEGAARSAKDTGSRAHGGSINKRRESRVALRWR